MNYFKDCQCIEDVKTLYKKLCFKFHPDVSTEPNACEIMKEVNKQYDEAFKRLKTYSGIRKAKFTKIANQ